MNMIIQDEDRWRFLNMLQGKSEVLIYEDGISFNVFNADQPSFGGKDWKSAVDKGIKLFVKDGWLSLPIRQMNFEKVK